MQPSHLERCVLLLLTLRCFRALVPVTRASLLPCARQLQGQVSTLGRHRCYHPGHCSAKDTFSTQACQAGCKTCSLVAVELNAVDPQPVRMHLCF